MFLKHSTALDMGIEMRIYGIAIFEVNKDLDVVILDLENAGLHRLEYMEIDPDLATYLDMAEEEFGDTLGRYRTIKDYVFEYENERLVLIRFFMQGKRVGKVLLVSLRAGTLRSIVKRLENIGWNRLFMFEIKRLMRSIKYTDH
ncbi:conserved hypothetical protein [Vulcanisaeta distributa DSM 14429]|uniref:Uncharacterized protein n=2 Tax=Vulcanisaeta distributa TaxID=164451 RepID=E1QSZ5_VULDI|nr:conserved hypothetical protein [Vulcanisaeta distributa DSM 14429]